MKLQYIFVVDGMGNGIGMQAFLKNIFRGFVDAFFTINLYIVGIFFKNRRTGKAKELCIGEEIFDGFMVIAKLAAVAFVENKHQPLFCLMAVSRSL